MELIILEYLKENPYTNIIEVRDHTTKALQMRGVEIDDNTVLLINSIIWDLICERILTPGKNMDNLDLPFIHVDNMDKLKNRFNKNTDF